MAEIEIEKKKPIWPWIILVLIILAILYFLFFANDDDQIDDMETTTEEVDTTVWDDDEETTTWDQETGDTMTGGGISAYISHVGDKSRMGIDHEYTNTALLRLIEAVQAKADEMNYNIDADMQSIRQDAREITDDPYATDHANHIKNAGTKLANVLERMQQEDYPDLNQDVQEVKTAANNIDASTLTLEQKENVNTFFDEAADVLRKMQ